MILAFWISCFSHGAEKVAYSQNNLFELLVANFARHHQDPKTALRYYLSQAKMHRSPKLAEQATLLALSLKDKHPLLTATEIWLESQPQRPRAHFFSAIASAHNNQPKAAIAHMKQAEAMGHATDYTWIAQLLDHTNSSTVSQALQTMRFAAQVNNTNYDAMIALCLLLTHTPDHQTIPALLEKAMQLGQSNPMVFSLAGDIYQTLEQTENAQLSYEKGALMHPRQINLRLKLATLLQKSDPQSALMHYEMLNLQIPNSAFLLKNLAVLYQSLSQTKKAERVLQQLLTFSEQVPFANLQLANIAMDRYDTAQALDLLQQIPEKQQVQAIHLKVISHLITEGKTALARRRIKKHLSSATYSPYIIGLKHLHIAALTAENRHKEALKRLAQHIDQHPDHLYFRIQSALLASQLYSPERFAQHLHTLFNQALDKTKLLEQFGQKLAITNQDSIKIKQHLASALALSPQNPILLDSYGWLLYRMGRLEDAAFWVSKALNNQPSAKSAAHLGEILWALGDKEQAKRIFSEAVELTPNDRELNNTLERFNVSFVSKNYP